MKVKRFASKVKLAAALALAMGLVSTAHAATTYTVHGTQGYSIDSVTDSVASGGLGAILTQDPNPPAFSGLWSIDLNTGVFLHSFDFSSYSVSVDMTAASLGIVEVTIPHRVLAMTTGWYTPIFSVGTGGPGFSITQGTFVETSVGLTCNDGGSGFCAAVPGPSTPSHGTLTLTLAADLLSFTGVARVYQNIDLLAQDTTGICIAEGGANPCANNTLTFSGVAEVPVPAAAWLFGSGVLGLAGLKRRKAA